MLDNRLQTDFLNTELSDYVSLLNLSSKIVKKNELTGFSKRIAVIGTSSIQMIVMVLKAMLICEGLEVTFYEGQYDGLKSDIYDDSSELYAFEPDVVIMIPDIFEIKNYPSVLSGQEEVLEIADAEIDVFLKMFEKIHLSLPDAAIFCSNIVGPFEKPLGNLEGSYIYSKQNFISILNLKLMISKPNYVSIIDSFGLACEIGYHKWFDPSAYVTSKQAVSLINIGYFCNLIKLQIMALVGKAKKCLVLDLDNTIWGGVVGDLGAEGVLLDPNDSEGEAYLSFQNFVLKLKERGVILAVCSKNDEQIARKPFVENQYMKIKLEDISCFVANWEDKVSNIRYIANKLNIGLDSIVFFDDNPTERALVKKFIPEVYVVNVPKDPAFFSRALDSSHAFDWIQITKEDLVRTDSYIMNQKREQLRLSYDDYDEYLKQLNMSARFYEIDDADIQRFVQLLNKTNQFNFTTHRYSLADIERIRKNEKYGLYAVTLSDCYSDYGIISCLVLEYVESQCNIVDWCMSCRVIKKSVENFVLSKIISICKERGVGRINGEYIKTEKNRLVESLYEQLGFEETMKSTEKSKKYYLDSKYFTKANTISFIKEIMI